MFVYLAALENGYELDTLLEDKRRRYKNWSPRNFKERYLGTVTLKEAFSKSLNTVAVDLCDKLGPQKVIKMARKFGITTSIPPNLSIALGTCDNTLLEMSAAFGAIAVGGAKFDPFGVLEVKSRDNQDLYSLETQEKRQIIDIITASQIDELLEEVVKNGTGKRAAIPGKQIKGKTGTTQNHKDAWFIGYTQDHIIGVWIGNDLGEGMKEITGGSGPALIFKDIVNKIDLPGESMESILQELEG